MAVIASIISSALILLHSTTAVNLFLFCKGSNGSIKFPLTVCLSHKICIFNVDDLLFIICAVSAAFSCLPNNVNKK